MSRNRLACVCFLFVMTAGSSALAQVQPTPAAPSRPPATVTPQATTTLGSLDLTVNWRSRAEDWGWFAGNVGDSDYGLGHSQLRVGVGQKRSRVDWFVEGEQATILLVPNGAVAPAPLGQLGLGGTYYAANGNSVDSAGVFLKQAYVQLKQLGQTNLKVGRFEFFDGVEARSTDPLVTNLVNARVAHRLISNFGFTAVQRTFDGAQFAWNSGRNNVTLYGGRPTEGIFQVQGMKELDVQVYYGAYNRSIKTENGAGVLRVFGVGYVDNRTDVLKTDDRPAGVRAADHSAIKLGTWGADYVHVVHTKDAGTFDVVGWGVVQTGAWGTLTQRAGAFVGEAGWQSTTSPLRPWISAGYSWGSGDSNPNDSTNGTFFQVLTTPRQYARFPFYNMMNNEDAYATLSLRPTSKLAVRSELHGLWLANTADLWYLGGGAFQQTTFGFQGRPSEGDKSLATVWDLSGDYPLTRYLSLTAYYAYASGKGAISTIYPNNSNGHLAYLETTVHF